jgi:integrase
MCSRSEKGFHTACKIAGIEALIWKDLRATFGTRLAEAGCDAFTIAQLLGHSDIRVTMRYVRAVEGTKRWQLKRSSSAPEKMAKYWPVGQNSRQCRRL